MPRTQLDGVSVKDHPPDGGGDEEEHFLDAEEGCYADDGGDKFIEIADMSEKRERAETPTTLQGEHVHKAFAVHEDADQEGHDDHVAAAGQEKGDGAAKARDVGGHNVLKTNVPDKADDSEDATHVQDMR